MNLNVCFTSTRYLYANILYPENISENTFRTQTLFKEQVKKKQYISKEKVLSFFSLNTELLNNKDCYYSEKSIFTQVKNIPHNPPNPPPLTIIWTRRCVLYALYHTRQHVLEGESRMISSAQPPWLYLPTFM